MLLLNRMSEADANAACVLIQAHIECPEQRILGFSEPSQQHALGRKLDKMKADFVADQRYQARRGTGWNVHEPNLEFRQHEPRISDSLNSEFGNLSNLTILSIFGIRR